MEFILRQILMSQSWNSDNYMGSTREKLTQLIKLFQLSIIIKHFILTHFTFIA